MNMGVKPLVPYMCVCGISGLRVYFLKNYCAVSMHCNHNWTGENDKCTCLVNGD